MKIMDSREDAKNQRIRGASNLEQIATSVIDCGFHLHNDLGPGLLETAYETILAASLRSRGLQVDRQVPIKIKYNDLEIEEGFRADLLIENMLLVELKSVERIAPVHGKQVLTYLKLMNLPLGLLINFGAPTFKEGIKRIVNNHIDFATSRLCVNQTSPKAQP